jgi:hypothetical protein
MKKLFFTLIAAVTLFSQSAFAAQVYVMNQYGRVISSISNGHCAPTLIYIWSDSGAGAYFRADYYSRNLATNLSSYLGSTTGPGQKITIPQSSLAGATPGTYQIEARFPALATKSSVNFAIYKCPW